MARKRIEAPQRRTAPPVSTPKQQKSRTSLVDRAYDEIRRRILDNEYTPAQQVLEQELAADLGMSRTPVREALVRLQNEHFVQIVPRHGMRVVPLSLSDLSDMYEVLTALELTAIGRLVRTRPDKKALAPLESALDEMDRALLSRDMDKWVRADDRFHRTLIESAGNRRLAAMAYSVWEQAHRARKATVRLRPALDQSNREHRALLAAVRKGDQRTARAVHARHRERTSSEIMRLLEHTRLGSF